MLSIPQKRISQKKGQVMLVVVVFFMSFVLIVSLGLINPIIKQFNLTSDIWKSKESYYVSESGIEDVIFRIKSNMTVGSSENLVLNGFDVNTSITSTLNGKSLITESDRNGYTKKIETKIREGEGVSFNYGIQTGNGGFYITGGSSVVGNVYSNGDIIGGSGVHITGSAVAATGGIGIFKDQSNEIPLPVPYGITFNNTGNTRDFAQSFQPSTTSAINRISVYIKKNNSPSDFSVKLMSDNNGIPGTQLAVATLIASNVSTNYGWVDLVFTSDPVLNTNTTYWFVIEGDTKDKKTSTNTYTIGANTSYSLGVAKIGTAGGVWNSTSPSGLDGYFSLYLGSAPAQIWGNEGDYMYIGSTSTDIAWSSSIKHIRTPGKIYCQTSSNNYGGKTCDTSRSNPETLPLPVSESNIDQWKSEAESGNPIIGNLIVDWDGDVIGNKKITGNLTVNGGGTLLITGTVWVQGYIIVTGGGKIKISPSLGPNSAVILTDKYARIDGDGKFEGSGTVGSYPVVVSTSVCPSTTPCAENNSAISLSGGAGAVVLIAPFGRININGGSGARAVTADSIYISGGGTVTYETGLANLSFSSGPSGGFNIESWRQLEQ
ncbi:MAG: choice-of-anchor R domain-containing protein [bacterium]